MPVIGMSIKNIDAKREKDEINGQVKISSNTDLKSIKEIDVQTLTEKALSIDFEHKIIYEDDSSKIGNIMIAGSVLFFDKNQKDLLKEWQKSKKLPDEINLQVINNILRKCVTKSLVLSEDLMLPPPINLPIAVKGEKNKDI